MNTIRLFLWILIVCTLYSHPLCASTSLFNTQTTETLPNGRYELRIKAEKIATEKYFHTFSSFKCAFTNRFELGINAQLIDNKDTILYGKYRVFDEKNGLPSLAFGINRIKVNAPSSFYSVVTKTAGAFKFSVEGNFENNKTAMLGGFEAPLNKNIIFMADYVNKNYNLTTCGFSIKVLPECNLKLGYGFAPKPQNNTINLQFTFKGKT